jgi:hypothetical protein
MLFPDISSFLPQPSNFMSNELSFFSVKFPLKKKYRQIKKGMHLNSIVSLIRLIKFYLEVLSQTDIEKCHCLLI